MSFHKHINHAVDYSLRAHVATPVNPKKPLFEPGAGLRAGHVLIDNIINSVKVTWSNMQGSDRDGVNAVVLITMGSDDTESLVTMVFNPETKCNANNMPELEAENYVRAIEYLKGACANRGAEDRRIGMAVDRILKHQSEQYDMASVN